MRLRIGAALLLVSILVAVFGVTISADNSSGDMSLEEEMKSNISGFDPDTYVGTHNLTVVGATTNELNASRNGYYLYIYVHDPDRRNISHVNIDLSVVAQNDGRTYQKNLGQSFGAAMDSTSDRSFHKLRFDLSAIYPASHSFDFDTIAFSWSYITVYSIDSNSWMYDQFTYYQNNMFLISVNDDGTSEISFTQSEIATLDVEYTCYRTSATDGWKTRDEIHSVWFSIPNEFKEYYDYLYSVSSIYTKKHLKPTIVNPANYISDYNSTFISSDYTTAVYNTTLGYPTYYYADTVIGTTRNTIVSYYSVKNYIDLDEVGMHVDGDTDCNLSSEDLIAYIKSLEEMGGKCDFYEGTAEVYTAANPSTKTVDESWTSIPYAEKASYFDISEEYGFTCGFLMWLYRNSPDKLQEIAERYAVDVNYDKLLSSPQPYLVLVDDETKKEIASLSDAEVSKNYLIDIDDVQSFRTYLSRHDNVVLYRFDVTEYYSEYLYMFTQLTDGSLKPLKDRKYAVIQQYLFFDFQVIDVTFDRNGEYISLNVYSDPIDVGGDIEVPSDEPPITLDPDVGGLVEDIRDNIVNRKDSVTSWLRRALVVVGVIAGITAFVALINVFKSDNVKIYLNDNDVNKHKKE